MFCPYYLLGLYWIGIEYGISSESSKFRASHDRTCPASMVQNVSRYLL